MTYCHPSSSYSSEILASIIIHHFRIEKMLFLSATISSGFVLSVLHVKAVIILIKLSMSRSFEREYQLLFILMIHMPEPLH